MQLNKFSVILQGIIYPVLEILKVNYINLVKNYISKHILKLLNFILLKI